MAMIRHLRADLTNRLSRCAAALTAATLAIVGLGFAAMPSSALAAATVSTITLDSYYVEGATAVYNGVAQVPETLTLTATDEAQTQPETITVTVGDPTETEGVWSVKSLSWAATEAVEAGSIEDATELTGLAIDVSNSAVLGQTLTAPIDAGDYYLFMTATDTVSAPLVGADGATVSISGKTTTGSSADPENVYTISVLDLSHYKVSGAGLIYTGEPLRPGELTLTTNEAGYPPTLTFTSGASTGEGTYGVASGAIGETELSTISGFTITTTMGDPAQPTTLEEVGTYGVEVAASGHVNLTGTATGTLEVASDTIDVEFAIDGTPSVTSASNPKIISALDADGLEVTVNFDAPEGTTVTATVAVASGTSVTLKLPTGGNAAGQTSLTGLSSGDSFVIVPAAVGPATIHVTLAASGEDAGDITTGDGANYYVSVVAAADEYTLSLDSDSMTYNSLPANPTANVNDVNGSAVPSGQYKLQWYLDESLTKPTGAAGDTTSGASAEYGAPVNAGVYYVCAAVTQGETTDYSNVVDYTIEQASFTVVATPIAPMTLTLPTDANGKTVKVLFAGVSGNTSITATATATVATSEPTTEGEDDKAAADNSNTPTVANDQNDLHTTADDTPATAASSRYEASITGCATATNAAGEAQVIGTFTFTNNSDATISPMRALNVEAYQDGVELQYGSSLGIPATDYDMNAQWRDVMPGATSTFQSIFALDNERPVTFVVTDLSYMGSTGAGELAKATFDLTTGKEIGADDAASASEPIIELSNASNLALGDSFTVVPKRAGTATVAITVTPTPTAQGGASLDVQNYRATTMPYQVTVVDTTAGGGGGQGAGSGAGSGAGLAQTGDASAGALAVLGIIVAASIVAMVAARRRHQL